MQFKRMVIVVAASMCAAKYGATEEIIEVHGCGVGLDLIENGEAFHCIRHGGNDHSGGWDNHGGGGHDNDNGATGGGGDGSGSAVPEEGGPPLKPWAEYVRLTNCHSCKTSTNACMDQAALAENTCKMNGNSHAAQRCDFEKNYQNNRDGTVAAWGCSITDLRLGHCTEAEGWWRDTNNWDFSCDRSKPSGAQCSGAGIDNCVSSWALSHPGGSTTTVEGYGVSATFEGFGGTASQTFTTMFTLNAQTGFNKACTDVGNALVGGCTSAQLACYSQYSCTEADFQ